MIYQFFLEVSYRDNVSDEMKLLRDLRVKLVDPPVSASQGGPRVERERG